MRTRESQSPTVPVRRGPDLKSFPGLCAAALAVLLAWGTVTIWAPQRWTLNLAQAGLLLLGLVCAVRLFLRPERLVPAFPLYALGLAVVWAFILCASGRSVYPAESWDALAGWLVALASTALGLHLFSEDKLRHWFLWVFLCFGVVLSVVALLQFYTSNGKIFWLFPYRYPDVLGPFQNRNNFAAFVELLVPVALWHAFREHRDKMVYLAMAAVLVGAVVASGSRAGAVLVFLEVLAVFAIAHGQGRLPRGSLMRTAARTFGLAGVAILVAGWEILWRRIQAGNLLQFRREILESTLAMIGARPFTGFGPGTFQTVYPAFATFDVGLVVNHAHNDWLEWAAEAGLPFALLLISAAVWCIRPAVRSVWGIGLLAVFVHALADYPMQRLGVAGWVFVLIGALAAEHLSQNGNRHLNP